MFVFTGKKQWDKFRFWKEQMHCKINGNLSFSKGWGKLSEYRFFFPSYGVREIMFAEKVNLI